MNFGMVRVAAAVPRVEVANVDYNLAQIEKQVEEACRMNVQAVVFPELCITGYSCQDLFAQRLLIDEAEKAVVRLMEFTRGRDIAVIVGVPVDTGKLLLNCAAVVACGRLCTLVPKTYLPNYGEFYEKRWFASLQDANEDDEFRYAGTAIRLSKKPVLFTLPGGANIGVEICEDLWAPVPPSNHLALAGADIVFNLSASDELTGKHSYLRTLIAQQSARTMTAYVYSSCGFGESTQDVVYGGNAIVCENGRMMAEGQRFSFDEQMAVADVDVELLRAERRRNTTFVNAQRGETPGRVIALDFSDGFEQRIGSLDPFACRTVNPWPFIPPADSMKPSCEEIFSIQVMGLAKRLDHTHSKHVVLGISGGLDSTLALLVCVRTFDKLGLDRKGIIGVTMPGFGTTDRTHDNASSLMQSLGISQMEISIAKAVQQHFEDIGHDSTIHDATYENSQARERTQILMDLANKCNAIVVGTGDLSELALGWATYNGDHMSMYGVNGGIPKTLIQYLVRYIASLDAFAAVCETLIDIIDTPISPELTPADEEGNIKQKTEDLVGPYELHDFFLYYMLRFGFRPAKIFIMAQRAFGDTYDKETIKKWLTTFCRRFFSQQFKRSCLPDGPKVGSISLSPRGDWRMPSDACSTLWLKECEEL